MFHNIQVYFLQKIRNSIFTNNDNRKRINNFFDYLQKKVYKSDNLTNNRKITLHSNEYKSIMKWLMYCNVNQYTEEIDAINNNNDKHNLIKTVVNKIISGRFETNHANPEIALRRQNCYIVAKNYFDNMLSIEKDIKLNSYGNKSFIK